MDIKDVSPQQLEEKIISFGFPKYRAAQILNWLYKKDVGDFYDMDNLPAQLRKILKDNFTFSCLTTEKTFRSKIDKTIKYLFRLKDGNYVETVLVPMKGKFTVCVSTQVGCRFACRFCATGMMGFIRNLTVGEIVEQVLIPKRNYNITNVVFMGMGEPLDNYDNVIGAIKILNSAECLNIGARKITVSTCGIPDKIKKLAELGLQIELSVSLHAPNNEVRNKLVPINKKYPIETILDALKVFIKKTKRKVTFEYVLIDGINDSEKLAHELSTLVKDLNPKVNIIPLSFVDDKFKPSRNQVIFTKILQESGITATIRQSKGQDIQAACGQLRGSAI